MDLDTIFCHLLKMEIFEEEDTPRGESSALVIPEAGARQG
jgi:hypothetical protein